MTAKEVIAIENTLRYFKIFQIIESDALLLVTEWPEFRVPNFNVIGKILKNKVVFDGRNIYDRQELRELGFDYYGIGLK